MIFYRRHQKPAVHKKAKHDHDVGIWSRSKTLRKAVWASVIVVVVILAVFATTYLSGFDSVFEMIEWYRTSF